MKTSIFLTITGLALAPIALLGQIFPLSTNSWDNPEFRARFLGTYGFTTDLNPSVDRAEMELFQQIQGMIGTDPRGAITRLRSAITRDSSAALDQILGNLYYQEGEIERAIASYREAIRKFPTFFRAYQNLGRALVAEGRYDEALPMLLKAIELNGGDGSLYGLVGFSYLNQGRFATALDAYRFAIMFQPDNIDWQKGKLSCLMRLGQYNEAIGMIYELIARDPNNVEFWTWQSNAFLSLDDSARAAANLEILRMKGKASANSLQLLGDIYMNSGVSSLAIDTYRESFGTGGLLPRQAIRMVEALLNQNETDAAVEFLDRIPSAVELGPEDELTVLNLSARALLAQGKADEAAEILEQVVERDPMNGRALLLLSDYHMEKQSFTDALFYAQNASKVDATRVDGLLRMARVHVMQRNFREAARELRRAHELRPAPYIADYLNRVEQAAARL